jgi:hypothetical protein
MRAIPVSPAERQAAGRQTGALHCAAVKVATRITVATAVVVAIASAGYAFFDLRARTSERRMAMEREAKALANTLRTSLEVQEVADEREARYRAEMLQRDLEGIEKKAGDKLLLEPTKPAPTPQIEELRREYGEIKLKLLIVRRAAGLETPLDQALSYRPPSESQLKDLARASGGWKVSVVPRARASELPSTELTSDQLRRIRSSRSPTSRATISTTRWRCGSRRRARRSGSRWACSRFRGRRTCWAPRAMTSHARCCSCC